MALAANRPSTKDKLTLIKFKVATPMAQYMKLLGDEFGWGVSHTDVAKFVLMRELARLQEGEIHKRNVSKLPLLDDIGAETESGTADED